MEQPENMYVTSAFKFWGGNPQVLKSRSFFAENAKIKDKIAMAKLTDTQFKQLDWEPLQYKDKRL